MGDAKDNPPLAAYGFDESAVYHGPGPQLKMTEVGDYAVKLVVANKDRPFFVNIWLHQTHLPHLPTKESLARWQQLPKEQTGLCRRHHRRRQRSRQDS